MSKNKILAVSLVLSLLLIKIEVKANDMLKYKISITDPQTHYAKISIEAYATTNNLHFSMPSWTPGSYLIREFAKSVDRVKASINGIEIPTIKTDKGTWKVEDIKSKTVVFEYDLYAFELSVRTSFIDEDQAFLHNTSIFMLVEEQMSASGTLQLDYPSRWQKVSTSLEKENDVFAFQNYDDLADSPIQIGNQEIFNFEVAGVPHEVAMVGINNADLEKLSADMQRMCKIMTNIIGEHPCKRYVFIVHNIEAGGGGLEHKNSCTVMMPRWNYTNTVKYHSFLGLVAHEYFHLWNVKRIRPKALGPFDYKNENYTNLLWVAEGITSYYDEMSLYSFGYYDKKTYLGKLTDYINRVESQPGSSIQSLSESSWDAWIKAYRSNENSANTGISYYSKGLLVAMLLDAEIIKATKGKKNLDDLMQHLYKEFAMKDIGFADDEFEKAVNKIAGKDLSKFIANYVFGLKTPAYKEILEAIDIKVSSQNKKKASLGLITSSLDGKTIVKAINARSCSYLGGINVNDEIISINGIRVNNDVDEVLNALSNKDELFIMVSRDGLIKLIKMSFKPIPTTLWKLGTAENTKLNKSFFRE